MCWLVTLSWHQQIGLLLVLCWHWFPGFLLLELKRGSILRKCLQFVLEMQLNVLYVQKQHLLRFQLPFRSCKIKKQSDPFLFLLVVSAMKSFMRICCATFAYPVFISHKRITDAMTHLAEDFNDSFRAYNEKQYAWGSFIMSDNEWMKLVYGCYWYFDLQFMREKNVYFVQPCNVFMASFPLN